MWKLAYCLIFLMSVETRAYIPEFKTILSRTAENHGRGLYKVDWDVTLAAVPEPLVVKEVWLIRDENNMRVTLEGRGHLKGAIQGTIVYENGQKFYLDDGSSIHQRRIPEDFAEPYFFFRSAKNFRSFLLNSKIIPSALGRDRPPIKNVSSYFPPPAIRLGRVGGVVNYAIGNPTPFDNEPLPGLWIEQDQFLMRKVRLPSQVVFLADQFQRFEQDLWLPRVRSISWKALSAQLQFVDVRSYGRGSPEQNLLLNPKSLTHALSLKIPDVEALREFYNRFR